MNVTTPVATTVATTVAMEVPNYEFDVYPVRAMCTNEEGGLGPEILGDALIVVAQVYRLFSKLFNVFRIFLASNKQSRRLSNIYKMF